MKSERKCQTEQTLPTSQVMAEMHDGWCAARAGLANDATMGAAWVQGWLLFNSPSVQHKMLRVGLSQ